MPHEHLHKNYSNHHLTAKEGEETEKQFNREKASFRISIQNWRVYLNFSHENKQNKKKPITKISRKMNLYWVYLQRSERNGLTQKMLIPLKYICVCVCVVWREWEEEIWMGECTISAPKQEPQYVSLCSSLPPCLCKGFSICKRERERVNEHISISY